MTDFDVLVRRAIAATGAAAQRPVLEKELLHLDILYCLDRAGLLDRLTFQGDTALRLCYGSSRLSEDLDFAGGRSFTAATLEEMRDCIEGYIGQRYGLPVSVKTPAELSKEPAYRDLKVDRWQVSVITAPDRRDIPQQRIKIEVINIDAYTREPRALQRSYNFLPAGYSDTLVLTESLTEIMADKLVSLVACVSHIRYRDLWDLVWLAKQGAAPNVELINKKIADYRIENYNELLKRRVSSLPEILGDGRFDGEMRRFIPDEVWGRTLAKSKFSGFMLQTLRELLVAVSKGLGEQEVDGFQM